MKRGDEIEVSSDEEGLKGCWFRAILEDPLPKSGNKKLNVSLLAKIRQHFDWVKQEWVFVSKKSTFRCGTMVEVKVDDDVDVWVPSVIVKEMVNRKSFVVKSLKYLSWNDGEESKPNRTVGLSSIRLTPPTVSVKSSFGLMESVEVFIDPGWRPGTVTSILCVV
ncbi:unnamed protein product [Brassica oleracea var. botrytis]